MMRNPFVFIWRQPGGLSECPYFHRTVFGFQNGWTVRIHEWHADDDARHMHDHPQWFWTFIVKGGYTDRSEDGDARLGPGAIRYRPASYRHSVIDVVPGTITVLLTGRPSRRWGFWVKNKLIKRDKYFAVHGHHPCDPAEQPVRLKPGGARI